MSIFSGFLELKERHMRLRRNCALKYDNSLNIFSLLLLLLTCLPAFLISAHESLTNSLKIVRKRFLLYDVNPGEVFAFSMDFGPFF
jgi:hypothetical protein